MKFVLFETPLFTTARSRYLDDEALRLLQQTLLLEPDKGHVMQGTGGFRKLRWPDPRRGKGKRGGLRVIYQCPLT